MKRLFIFLLNFLILIGGESQNLDYRWEDHLSYYNLSDLCVWQSKVIASSEYSMVVYDIDERSISKFSKVQGLLGEKISSINSVDNADALVVAYETGEFSVIYSDSRVKQVLDIKSSSYPGTKSINSITEYKDKVYLGTDFGIVEYDIVKEEFGDTFYFGPGGQSIVVNSSSILNDEIFVATDEGVYKADLTDPLLIDYTKWILQTELPMAVYNSIASIEAKLVVNMDGENSDIQYLYNNGTWEQFGSINNVSSVKSFNDLLSVSAGNRVYYYDASLQLHHQIKASSENNFSASSSLYIDGDYYVSSSNIGLALEEEGKLSNITPGGPQKNYSFRVRATEDNIYLLYGYYDGFYTPKGRYMGYELYDGKDWTYIDRSNFGKYNDIVDVSVNPLDKSNIFFTSWGKGMVELVDNRLEQNYDHTNSALQKLFYAPDPNYVSIRIGGSVYDSDANLWIANGWNVENPIVLFDKDRNWHSFPLSDISRRGDNGMGDIILDQNSVKYIPTRDDGIYVYHEGESLESSGDDRSMKFTISEGSGSLPSIRVNTLAVDKDNILWIGCEKGLVVFTDTDNIFDLTQFDARPIIIEEDGVGKILLGSQKINKIVVDGSNKKWFATDSGGVYYTSANGQKTIYHFTVDNSPLLSNTVIDLDIDPNSGKVYFVTDKGLISFLGNATQGDGAFSNVMAYPNPVPPSYSGDIFIKGLSDRSNVKITDISGNLVYETTSEGGQAIWDGRSLNGSKVSSGVYLVFAISYDGSDTAVTKILIVN